MVLLIPVFICVSSLQSSVLGSGAKPVLFVYEAGAPLNLASLQCESSGVQREEFYLQKPYTLLYMDLCSHGWIMQVFNTINVK